MPRKLKPGIGRTTVEIDENVLKQMQKRSIDLGITNAKAIEDSLRLWLSGESTTPAKAIAPSTDVRHNTITAGLQVSIDRVPASLRPEFLAVLEAIADLLSKGLGFTTEGLQVIDERMEREAIDRRAEALGEPALGVAGTEGQDIDTAREPTGARRGKAKPK